MFKSFRDFNALIFGNIHVFRVTGTFINLLLKPRFTGKHIIIILCILKGIFVKDFFKK